MSDSLAIFLVIVVTVLLLLPLYFKEKIAAKFSGFKMPKITPRSERKTSIRLEREEGFNNSYLFIAGVMFFLFLVIYNSENKAIMWPLKITQVICKYPGDDFYSILHDLKYNGKLNYIDELGKAIDGKISFDELDNKVRLAGLEPTVKAYRGKTGLIRLIYLGSNMVVIILSAYFLTFIYREHNPKKFYICPHCNKSMVSFCNWKCDHCNNIQGENRELTDPCIHCKRELDSVFCEHCHEEVAL